MNRRTVRGYRKVSYYQQLRAAIRQFLPSHGLPLQVPNGKVCWVPRMLVIAAILMSWASGKTLEDRFAKARDGVVGMYKSRRRPGGTYQGFMMALLAQSSHWLAIVCQALQQAVRRLAGDHWHVEGWLVFGVDGSRIDCPQTRANEQAFGCAGKKKTGPQQLLTTLLHVGTGLIWAWRRGPSTASERDHLRQMLEWLPADSLLLADAGFTGYDLLGELQRRGVAFVIRAGRNVHLLKKLGYWLDEHDGIVYLWPSRQQKQKVEPLVLRQIVLTDERNRPVHLLSSVLQTERLSDAAAGRLYRRRWGLELMYRALKQTLERRKMLSDVPERAEVELDWTLVGLWMLGLLGWQQRQRTGQPTAGWSVAASLRVLRRAMDQGATRPRHNALVESLAARDADLHTRPTSKQSRHRKNKKTERPPGAPKVRMAEATEVLLAKQLAAERSAA